jgi:hypothetical protein
MAETKKKPTKTTFILSQGGLTGIWRAFVLAEVYTLLVALLFGGIAMIENVAGEGSQATLGIFLGAILSGQVVGVVPAVIIGAVTGLAVAGLAIALTERTAATKLAAGVALLLTIVVDLLLGVPAELGLAYGYVILFGVPYLIFVLEAARQTRKKLPLIEENFSPGTLGTGSVSILFWGALALRVGLFVFMFFANS